MTCLVDAADDRKLYPRRCDEDMATGAENVLSWRQTGSDRPTQGVRAMAR